MVRINYPLSQNTAGGGGSMYSMEPIPVGRVPVLKTVTSPNTRHGGSNPSGSSTVVDFEAIHKAAQAASAWKVFRKTVEDEAIYQAVREYMGPEDASLWRKVQDTQEGGNDMALPTGGMMHPINETVYKLYEPGKRNPVSALLIQRNPDGTGNFIKTDGNGQFNFILGLPMSSPYHDDANKSYAVKATVS